MKTITSDELKWVALDLDETLAHNTGYPKFNLTTPMKGAREACFKILAKGFKPVIYTARNWSEYNIIEDWVHKHNFPIKRIICGKPLFRWIVDDKNIEFKGNWNKSCKKIR